MRHACGVECASHADCADAGLVGWACDTRALGEVNPTFAGDERTYGFCARPICE
ncbi:MAG: hypothetical protein M5U28_51655 [Sandaracinaceae bacterium]|nr:hypothetical protein [Sandaracinaceae bacterium]